jgi:hypothetical protein
LPIRITEKCERHKINLNRQLYTDHEAGRQFQRNKFYTLTGTVTGFAFGVGDHRLPSDRPLLALGRSQFVRRKPLALRCLERSESESTGKTRWLGLGPSWSTTRSMSQGGTLAFKTEVLRLWRNGSKSSVHSLRRHTHRECFAAGPVGHSELPAEIALLRQHVANELEAAF